MIIKKFRILVIKLFMLFAIVFVCNSCGKKSDPEYPSDYKNYRYGDQNLIE